MSTITIGLTDGEDVMYYLTEKNYIIATGEGITDRDLDRLVLNAGIKAWLDYFQSGVEIPPGSLSDGKLINAHQFKIDSGTYQCLKDIHGYIEQMLHTQIPFRIACRSVMVVGIEKVQKEYYDLLVESGWFNEEG